MRKWGVVFGLVALAGFLVLLLTRSDPPPQRTRIAESLPEKMEEASTAADGLSPREDAEPSRKAVAIEADIEFDALEGIVRSPQGATISGAKVSWTFLAVEDKEWEGAWHQDDWGELERETSWAESDAEGRFVFPTFPADRPLSESVVWATHPRHRAAARVLTADVADGRRPLELVLEPAKSITVEVRDGNGHPAVGARVDQYGLTPAGAPRGADGINEERVRRLLHRTATTNGQGSVDVGPFPGEQVLVASMAEERSKPWRGREQERVTLTLAPSFQVSGRVLLPDWGSLNYRGERRIAIAAQSGNLWRSLSTIRAVEAGPWGPVDLPVLDVEHYRIRLEGSPIIPVEIFFEPPVPGELVSFDLQAEIGADLWFLVTDEEGEVIPEAVVRVSWQDPEAPQGWRFVERRAQPANQGQINVWSVPEGSITFEASAPGYVPYRSTLVPTAACDDNYAPITLKRAARLRGRCLHLGKPVEDFEVITWQTADRNSRCLTQFFDRSDGSFELDTVPAGEFWITCSSDVYPAMEPRRLLVEEGETAEVVLDLPSGSMGRGLVVDEATGQGLSTASIQLFIRGDIAPIARWGTPHPVNSDGTFEMIRFVPGENHLRAIAPGYSNKTLSRVLTADETLDWGTIALSRSQTFVVRLESEGSPLRPGSFLVTGRGPVELPPKVVSDDGTVVYEDASAGAYNVRIEPDDGPNALVLADWMPGEDWVLTHRVAGPNRLTIEILAESRQALPEHVYIEASHRSRQGFETFRWRPLGSGLVADIEGIDASSVRVILRGEEEEELATSSGSFVDGRLHLAIPMGGDRFSLRVLDREGAPLSDVRVIVEDPQRPDSLWYSSTDASGECKLGGVPPHTVLVHLQHGTAGSHFGLECDASDRSAEVVLDGQGKLSLLFLDGTTPVPGVACDFVDTLGRTLFLESIADDAGRIEIPKLALDSYRMKAWKADCWTIEFEATAHLDGGPSQIQIRRLGDLELELLASSGLPVSGMRVHLQSAEFGTDVAEWIEAGRVACKEPVTDLHGQILVQGLPRGLYRWRVDLEDGPFEGELEVQPLAKTEVPLMLP